MSKSTTREISLTQENVDLLRSALLTYAREARGWAAKDGSNPWLGYGKSAERLAERLQDATGAVITIDLADRRQRRRWEREQAALQEKVITQLREAITPGQYEQRGLSAKELSARLGDEPSPGVLKHELNWMQRHWLAEQVPGTLSPTGRVTANTRWRLPCNEVSRHEAALLREAIITAMNEQPGLTTRSLAERIRTRDLSDIRRELVAMRREGLIQPGPGTLSPTGRIAWVTRWTLLPHAN